MRRNGQVILTTQFSDLLAGSDIAVQKGDEIVVRPNSRVFTVLGAVQKSGNVEMTKHNLTLLEALGQVGGLSDSAPTKRAFMCSEWATWRPTRRPVDGFSGWTCFNRCLFLSHSSSVCRPRDVIYVTNAPLYEYDKILTSIYRTFSIIGIARGTVPLTTTF